MDKYYIPTSEELLCEIAVGGEVFVEISKEKVRFEIDPTINIANSMYKFLQSSCGVQYTFTSTTYNINPERFLLKYLDREDIESCGFKYDENMSEFDFDCYTIDKGLDDKKRYIRYMLFNYRNGNVFLEKTIDCSSSEIGFLNIKNKSALKTLLKQLGI